MTTTTQKPQDNFTPWRIATDVVGGAFLTAAVIIFSVLIGWGSAGCGADGCEYAGGSTLARKPVAYRGDPNATEPYIEVGKITDRDKGCSGSSCEGWASLGPWIHNPTNQELPAKIVCTYWFGGAEMIKSKAERGATVKPHASRKFEGFDWLYSYTWNGTRPTLAARCTANFGLDYPERTGDAQDAAPPAAWQ